MHYKGDKYAELPILIAVLVTGTLLAVRAAHLIAAIPGRSGAAASAVRR